MSDQVTSPPKQKHPLLHKLIDELPAEELELVERLLTRLEMDRLWKEVREGFAEDWTDGKYMKLDEIIHEVRMELKAA